MRGRVEAGQVQMATGQLADVAELRRNGWIAEHGGFVFPNDSALSHKTKEMIDWELMNTHHDVIPMYQERAVWESRYPQRAWGPSSTYERSEHGAVSDCKMITTKELSDVSRKEREKRIIVWAKDFPRPLRA